MGNISWQSRGTGSIWAKLKRCVSSLGYSDYSISEQEFHAHSLLLASVGCCDADEDSLGQVKLTLNFSKPQAKIAVGTSDM